jgi:hypothetical protein
MRFRALRRIPRHALALKKYFSGTASSKIEDSKDAPALGDPKSSVEYPPSKGITVPQDLSCVKPLSFRRSRHNNFWVREAAEFLEDLSEVFSFSKAEDAGDVFPKNESWMFSAACISHLLYDPHGLEEQAAARVLQPFFFAGDAEPLAGRARRYDIDGRDFASVELGYVPEVKHVGKVPLRDFHAVLVYLARPHGRYSEAQRRAFEAADSRK